MDSDTDTDTQMVDHNHSQNQTENRVKGSRTAEHEIAIEIETSRSSSSCSVIEETQVEPVEDNLREDAKEEKIVISRNLPNVNVPEKIVLCIDTSEDHNHTPFKLGDGTKYPPLYMIRRVTEIFMNLKNTINKVHEFALVVLHGNKTTWVRDFTSDPRMIIIELEKLTPTAQDDIFDLSSLFDVLRLHIPMPPLVNDPVNNAPAFVPRVIFLYSRSKCMPAFLHGRDSFLDLTRCIYFTLDIIYIHEDVSDDNKCEEIFRVLNELDHEGFSYMFDVLRNATRLHDHMAKLLAHPLQRPLQKQAAYKLECV